MEPKRVQVSRGTKAKHSAIVVVLVLIINLDLVRKNARVSRNFRDFRVQTLNVSQEIHN